MDNPALIPVDNGRNTLPAARRADLTAHVRRNGIVRISDLAGAFGVSDMTIRRDINALVDAGVVERVRGGVKVPGDLSSYDPGFSTKLVREGIEKKAITEEAASLVPAGSTIGIGGGTTTWTLARALASTEDLTIVTNSVPAADIFYTAHLRMRGRRGSVILTGGERTPSGSLVGPFATNAFARLHLDALFLGTHGMDIHAGLTSPNLLEVETNRAFASIARKTVVLADHTKWGIVGIGTMLDLEDVDVLISDDGLPLDARESLSEHVGELRIVNREI